MGSSRESSAMPDPRGLAARPTPSRITAQSARPDLNRRSPVPKTGGMPTFLLAVHLFILHRCRRRGCAASSTQLRSVDESAQWESNPHFRHGKAAGYRYIMGALVFSFQRSNSNLWSPAPHRAGPNVHRIVRAPGGTRTHVTALRKRDLGR